MKYFSTFIAMLVFAVFLMPTDMNAQEKWGNSGKFEETHVFICPCAGEYLMGTLVFQVNSKGKMTLVTIKGQLIGVDSGERYVFNRVDHENSETGQSSLRVRTVRKSDGLVTNFTIYFQDGEIKAECM